MKSFLAVSALTLCAVSSAQIGTPPSLRYDYDHDTGYVRNASTQPEVIISFTVYEPQASWIRLYFDQVVLGGDLPSGNQGLLRITSHRDGAIQEMNVTHLRQWGNSTAYFNGDTVQVDVLAHPGTGARVVMGQIEAGLIPSTTATICGPADNRTFSQDPRVARLLPIGCTGWLIDDCEHCYLTAGHCQSGVNVAQFNVPNSNSNGSLNHPGPEDQYAFDSSSLQGNGGQGVGSDWAYFGTFPNSNTGLTPFESQGQSFVLGDPPPASGPAKIRITGHGTDNGTANQAQQTEYGPLVNSSGTQLGYRTDTTGGNSGSPVIHKQRDHAVGIHTHGGCSSTGGQNWGTKVTHSGIQGALASPSGVCAGPACVTIFQDGFESGDFNAGGWVDSGGGAKVTSLAALNSNFGARLKQTNWIEKSISTAGFTGVELSLQHRSKNYESGEELIIEYWNGSSWIEAHSTTDEIQWHNRNYDIGPDGDNNSAFKIRMRTTAAGTGERSDIDNVVLTGF